MRTLSNPSTSLSPSEHPSPMILSRAASLAVVFSFLSWAAANGASSDRIWQKAGGRPVVADSILEDNYDEVKYKRGSMTLTLEASKVKIIDFGDAPDSYEFAIEKRDAGEFENSVSLLKAAMSEAGVGAWIKTHGAFQLAETYRRWGAKDRSKYGEAIRYYDEALSKNPKARIRPDALYGRAVAQLGAGNLDKGLADLETLAKEAYANKYGIRWELLATRESAEALNDADRANDAKRAFSKLETSARGFAADNSLSEADRAFAAEMAGVARLEQGRVLIRTDKARDAERFFDQIVSDDKEVEGVRAAALVGKGEALQAQDKPKEAQFAFASVRIHHYSAEEARAEATYRLGLVAEALGGQEPNGSQKAQNYFLEVVQRFPGSRWATKAQEKLR